MKAILNRLKEPSSYAGLSAALGIIGLNLPADAVQAGIYVLAGVAGLVAFFLPDGK